MRIVKRFLIADPGASFSFKESFYRLRSLVEHGMPKQNEGEEKPAHVIMVSSVAASERKSTVAANPALSLAQKHRAVLLIDADLRNPSQIRMLGKDAAGPVSLAKLLQSELLTAKQIADAIVYDDETHLMTLLDVAPTKNPGICCPPSPCDACFPFAAGQWTISSLIRPLWVCLPTAES